MKTTIKAKLTETKDGYLLNNLSSNKSFVTGKILDVTIDEADSELKGRLFGIINDYSICRLTLQEAVDMVYEIIENEKKLIEMKPLKKVVVRDEVEEIGGYRGEVVGFGDITPEGRILKVRLEDGSTAFVLETLLLEANRDWKNDNDDYIIQRRK